MARLRPLAVAGGITGEKLALVGKVTGGKHRASEILRRARNQLVFHWDGDVVRRSTLEYARNARVVWIESNSAVTDVVHRLSFDVLSHALFYEVSTVSQTEQTDRAVQMAVEDVADATGLIVELFTAALFGYLKSVGADQRSRELPVKAQKEGK